MKKNILLLNFIASSILGLYIYLAQKTGVQLPAFINNYVNDFLIIPIVLSICLFVLRGTRKDEKFRISETIIIYIVLMYSLFFEIWMPNLSERYTADSIDFLTYSLGGFWFWFLQNGVFDTNK